MFVDIGFVSMKKSMRQLPDSVLYVAKRGVKELTIDFMENLLVSVFNLYQTFNKQIKEAVFLPWAISFFILGTINSKGAIT